MASGGSAGAERATAGGDAFAAAHARMMADPALQHQLQEYVPPVTPAWLKALARLLVAAWPILQVLIWIGLGALALGLIWLILRRFTDLRWPWPRRATVADDESNDEWRPANAPARALLAEADALAAEGRFGEAARLVLQRSVEDIATRRPMLVRPATTSRDLAATPDLPAAARPAFAAIAQVVEMSLFADRGASADAWARARGAYADFALAGNWQ